MRSPLPGDRNRIAHYFADWPTAAQKRDLARIQERAWNLSGGAIVVWGPGNSGRQFITFEVHADPRPCRFDADVQAHLCCELRRLAWFLKRIACALEGGRHE
jgi:hypothetical protein